MTSVSLRPSQLRRLSTVLRLFWLALCISAIVLPAFAQKPAPARAARQTTATVTLPPGTLPPDAGWSAPKKAWLVPFVFFSAMLAVYLLAPIERRLTIQKRMHADANFYLGTNVALAALSVVAMLAWRQGWLSWLAWLALIITLPIALRKALVEPAEDVGEAEAPL